MIEKAFAKRTTEIQNQFQAFVIEEEPDETNNLAVASSGRKPQQSAEAESHATNAATPIDVVDAVVRPCTEDPSGSRVRSLPPTDEPGARLSNNDDALRHPGKAKPRKFVGVKQEVIEVEKCVWERIEDYELIAYPKLVMSEKVSVVCV